MITNLFVNGALHSEKLLFLQFYYCIHKRHIDSNPGVSSNKPTHYLLDLDDFIYNK